MKPSSKLPNFNINIIPGIYRRVRITIRQVAFILVLAVCIIAAILIYQAIQNTIVGNNILRAEIAGLNNSVEIRRADIVRKQNIVGTIGIYKVIADKQGILKEDIEAIISSANTVPTVIETILYTTEDIQVSCPSDGYDIFQGAKLLADLRAFEDALVETEQFSTVTRKPDFSTPFAQQYIFTLVR